MSPVTKNFPCMSSSLKAADFSKVLAYMFSLAIVVLVLAFLNIQQYSLSMLPCVDTWNAKQTSLEYIDNCDYRNFVFGKHAHQGDPCLILAFQKMLLIPPPPYDKISKGPLSVVSDKQPTNKRKLMWIEKLLINDSIDKRGFFVECGANDGEFISPTYPLETRYNWTGLLIEANPVPFKKLLEKKRNVWAVNTAACIQPYPEEITFYVNSNITGVSGINKREQFAATNNITVQCIPMYTMIKALNIKWVDYLSLDVEGLELAILKTLPWDKVFFKVMTIEHVSIPGKQKALEDFLTNKSYSFIEELKDDLTEDSLYVHSSLLLKAQSIKREINLG